MTLSVGRTAAMPFHPPITIYMAISSLADSAVVPLNDRTAVLDLAFTATPLSLTTAGDTVIFVLTAVNTGTLRLRNVLLSVPSDINDTLSCTISNTSISAPAAAVLEPGAAITCTASLTVTTAHIEAKPKTLIVSADAQSVLGGLVPVNKSVVLTPLVRPALMVTIDAAACVKPTKSGTWR